jgi:hypothetical protein
MNKTRTHLIYKIFISSQSQFSQPTMIRTPSASIENNKSNMHAICLHRGWVGSAHLILSRRVEKQINETQCITRSVHEGEPIKIVAWQASEDNKGHAQGGDSRGGRAEQSGTEDLYCVACSWGTSHACFPRPAEWSPNPGSHKARVG